MLSGRMVAKGNTRESQVDSRHLPHTTPLRQLCVYILWYLPSGKGVQYTAFLTYSGYVISENSLSRVSAHSLSPYRFCQVRVTDMDEDLSVVCLRFFLTISGHSLSICGETSSGPCVLHGSSPFSSLPLSLLIVSTHFFSICGETSRGPCVLYGSRPFNTLPMS